MKINNDNLYNVNKYTPIKICASSQDIMLKLKPDKVKKARKSLPMISSDGRKLRIRSHPDKLSIQAILQ